MLDVVLKLIVGVTNVLVHPMVVGRVVLLLLFNGLIVWVWLIKLDRLLMLED